MADIDREALARVILPYTGCCAECPIGTRENEVLADDIADAVIDHLHLAADVAATKQPTDKSPDATG